MRCSPLRRCAGCIAIRQEYRRTAHPGHVLSSAGASGTGATGPGHTNCCRWPHSMRGGCSTTCMRGGCSTCLDAIHHHVDHGSILDAAAIQAVLACDEPATGRNSCSHKNCKGPGQLISEDAGKFTATARQAGLACATHLSSVLLWDTSMSPSTSLQTKTGIYQYQ
jgi:hypothetical protein